MSIKYETNDRGKLMTKCPHVKDTLVGSCKCYFECKHSMHFTMNNGEIACEKENDKDTLNGWGL